MKRLGFRLLVAMLARRTRTQIYGMSRFSILEAESAAANLLDQRMTRTLLFKKSILFFTALAIASIPFTAAGQRATYKSKYVDPAVYDGLFYNLSDDWTTNFALVISYDDNPIDQKPNNPGAPRVPGLYPSHGKRFDFERLEVIRNKVTFKTRTVDGVGYSFSGESGQGPVRGMDASILVPFIRGTLVTLKNGKVMKREAIKFGHAVVA